MGGPLVWKTPRAKRQLSGSEEMGDINPGLSPQLCPSCLGSLLSPRIPGLCEAMSLAAYHAKDMALGEGEEGRVRGLGGSTDKGEPTPSAWG